MDQYINVFIHIANDLIERQLDIISAPPNRKSQIIKCNRILETIIMRKALAYVKLRNAANCVKCNVQLVIIAPWWELDNIRQMHVCMRCNMLLCEKCVINKCICLYVSFITFDMYQQLETKFIKE